MNRKLLIVLFVLFDIFLLIPVVLLYFVPPIRYAAWSIVGRGQGCPISNAWQADSHVQELTRAKDRMLAGQKLLGTEGGLEHYETPKGEFWAPKGSRFILPFNLAEQEMAIYGRAPVGVRKGDIVLDCGANVGTYARYALDAGAEKVIAIEPAPDNIECLRRNFPSELASGRLVVVPKGVWDKDDVLELRVDPDNQAADSFVIERKGAIVTARVPLTTIDKLAAELSLPRVDLIKMDIEGAEVNALKGGRETIGRHHPRLAISAYHRPTDPVEIPATVRAAWTGYRIQCGPCSALPERWLMRPDVLIFF
jgi:FkbM family methyltransferase